MQKFCAFAAISIFVQFPKGSGTVNRGIDTDRIEIRYSVTFRSGAVAAAAAAEFGAYRYALP